MKGDFNMKKIIDVVAKVIFARNIIKVDGNENLIIPSNICGNEKGNADNIFLLIMSVEVNGIPRHLGITYDTSKKDDLDELKKFMEVATVDRYPEDMLDKTMRILAEDTPEKLIPLAAGYTGLDKCFILGENTSALKSFKLAKTLISA